MAETATVGELLIRVRADINQLEQGLAQAQNGIIRFSTRTTPGLRAVESAFRSLAFSAAGVPGPVGRLSQIMLNLGLGGSVATALLAGLAAIAGALALMEYRAKQALQRWQELQDATKFVGIHEKTVMGVVDRIIAGTAAGKIAELTVQLRNLRTELERQPRVRNIGDLLTAQEATAQGVPTAVTGVLSPEQRTRLAAAIRAIQQELTNALNKPFLEGLDRTYRQTFRMLTEATQDIFSHTGDWFRGVERGIRKTMDGVAASLKSMRGIQQAWREVGFAIGDYFVQGFQAATSGGLGGFLKNLGFSLLRGLVFGGIAAATGGTFLAGFGAGTGIPFGATEGGAGGLSASVSGVLDFSTFPAATNPLAAARDAEWQRFFRESGLVARTQGFR